MLCYSLGFPGRLTAARWLGFVTLVCYLDCGFLLIFVGGFPLVLVAVRFVFWVVVGDCCLVGGCAVAYFRVPLGGGVWFWILFRGLVFCGCLRTSDFGDYVLRVCDGLVLVLLFVVCGLVVV